MPEDARNKEITDDIIQKRANITKHSAPFNACISNRGGNESLQLFLRLFPTVGHPFILERV